MCEGGAGDGLAGAEDAHHEAAGDAHDAGEVGGAEAAVALGDGAGVDLDEDVAGAEGGAGELAEGEDVGGTVAGLGGGAHELSPGWGDRVGVSFASGSVPPTPLKLSCDRVSHIGE